MHNFVCNQRRVYYACIKMFNAFPTSIANQIINEKCFIKNLKSFLLDEALCCSEEFCTLCTWDEDRGCVYHVLNGIYYIIINFIKLHGHACLYGEI